LTDALQMKEKSLLLIISLLLIGEVADLKAQNRLEDFFPAPKNGNTYVIAHRGVHIGIPENSLAAYEKAIDLGCDFIEIDVRATKDGELVSVHNPRIDAYVSGTTGKVSDFTLEELKALDIGERIGPEWKGTRIPTFEEILLLCRGKIGIYLDLKEPLVPELVQLIKEYGMERAIVWYIPAYKTAALKDLKRLCPDCLPMPDPGPKENIATIAARLQPAVIATDMGQLNEEYMQIARENHTFVFVDEDSGDEAEWTKILEWGTEGIQSDHPEELIRFLTYKDFTKYVDPFIGTGGHGHTFPGAMRPFGMVQISPDTRLEDWDGSSGYHYSDPTIMGFSHTHLSGTGAPEFCDILLMPTLGKIQMQVGDEKDSSTGYRSSFNHHSETASPGYYSVLLDDYQVKAELTASTRSGFHQYTFPASDSSNIIIDLLNRDRVIEANIQVLSDTVITGFRRSIRWAKDQHVYFYAKFSRPFEKYGIAINDTLVDGISRAEGENIKACVSYQTRQDEKILVKIGISAVSVEGAKMNLEAENRGWDFEDIRYQAKKAWNKHLSRIELEGGSEREKRIFYTSLYHTAMAPIIFNDVDGQYRGVDLKVHRAEGFTRYSVFSLWDVFRAQMPLYTILEPSRMNDFLKTFLAVYKNGGRLPHWEIWGNYSGSMIGHHSLPVILDAYNKGIRDFDIDLAYGAMKNQLDHSGYYARMGYIPADKSGGSVSICLEYSYNDWCMAEMAKNLGKEEDFLVYQQRAQFYRNLFDPGTGFMRPKNSDRSWVDPFDPAEGSEHFVEGNSYQYSLFAPHDVVGLIKLLGGDKSFELWLDQLFTHQSEYDAGVKDASGLIGQYAHGNEPSHHMAYLYNYAGAAPKTQEIIRRILDTMYDDTPAGLEGNEDCGQMSAWYILSSMGFYPVNPGDANYIIGTPLFDRVTIHLENGKDFVIEARDVSDLNLYIQSATLNGLPHTKSWITHEDISKGGELHFAMGPEPNMDWGTSLEDRPTSMEFMPAVSMPYIQNRDPDFLDSIEVSLLCETEDAKIYYTLDGSEPGEGSPRYTAPFVLKNSTQIKFMAVKYGLQKSIAVTEKVNKLEYEAFHNYEDRMMEQGLKYLYYEGEFMFVSELSSLQPVEKGIISHFSIDDRNTDKYFGYEYKGFIRIPEDGAYTFYNKSNDGSILYLDGKEFINMDGGHPAHESFRTIALKKGTYRIAQKYFQMGGAYLNRVSWKGPGFEKTEIPSMVLFHEPYMPERGICAHRGAMDTHPENTLAAFKEAVRLGVHMIEFDVRLTRDGHLVILHDETVDRTSKGQGKIAELSLDEVKQLDAGSWKSDKFAGEKIPTLQEALAVMPANIWLNVHIKGGKELGEKVARVIVAEKRMHQAVIACGAEAAQAAKMICPEILICNMERQGNRVAYMEETIRQESQFIQLLRNRTGQHMDQEIARLKQHNIRVNYCCTNTVEDLETLLNNGVDFILTDRPSVMLEELAKIEL